MLAGVDLNPSLQWFYQYRSSGDPYGDSPLESLFYYRTTIGCEGRCYIFSPEALHPGEPAVTRSAWILAESLSIIQEAWIILDLILEKHWVFCRWILELR
ncbi:hypothetical protein HS121_17630 [bacterium]|nr:hypothetical protein [bacterium]